jgi:primosomal protein N' (replication factor Y)
MIAEVLVELKAKNIDKTFSYHIKENQQVSVGQRVLVPFGKQKLEGFVLKITDEIPDYEVKDIEKIIDEEPVINEEMLELGKFISNKTLCNLINCYQTMLPAALKAKNGRTINKKITTYISLIDFNYETNSLSQKKIIEALKKNKEIKKTELNKISVSSVKTLIKNNVIKEYDKEEYRIIDNSKPEPSNIILTEEQKKVLNQIKLDTFKPYLLYGVTGSGKTEVYMRVIEKVLKEKKEAIVLVPEISLTPQFVSLFKKRFGSLIAILHSRLSDGEKYDEWRKIERKEVSIVIGARSAIFAPFTNLGCIIIDEEHSSTYKQENNPRYHAIDIALNRAKRYNIPLILGSATPSIESFTRAKLGVYELCEMTSRVNKNLPVVTLVDMKDEMKKGNRILSEILHNKIEEKLNKNEQVIILLNRRGFTTITTCKNCGFTMKCPNCDIPLTYHKTSNTLRCHYCGYGHSKISECPECHSADLYSMGMGTEKLEEYLSKEFSKAKIIRMDIDTTTRKDSHEKIISSFRKEEYNILVGTQMISKGLDFPKVTLVGVINGDSSLNIPDFRSAERTFELLNQVAGRAGRSDLKGEVVIQGFNMDHYSIICASKHDYLGFYNEELKIRKILKYSPYYNLCLIKIKDKNFELTYQEANKIATHFKNKNLKDTIILGPSSSIIPKINNIYQLQIIIKYKDTKNIMKELAFINNHYRSNKISVEIDINPIKL